jgi:hypothetical protein
VCAGAAEHRDGGEGADGRHEVSDETSRLVPASERRKTPESGRPRAPSAKAGWSQIAEVCKYLHLISVLSKLQIGYSLAIGTIFMQIV